MTARVLVVDDVELNVKLLQARLAGEYFEVLGAHDGPRALELAEREAPDIILLDAMMPRMDGFEVCRRLKANPRTAEIPVLMVSALCAVADRLRALKAGAEDFLTKPVNDLALFARIRSLTRLKRMMLELRRREELCGRLRNAGQEQLPSSEAKPARILVIEEKARAAARIGEMLRPIATSVVHAGSCAEAQHLVDGFFELVIASLSMADGDMLRLVSQWRATETLRRLPILLMAGDGELPRLAKGLDLGADDYLVRPLDRTELLTRARTQIRRKRLQERLQENYRRSMSLALIDELTGVNNRRHVFAHLNDLVGGGAAQSALALIDVDHFKAVNDRFGHPVGDALLHQLAARVSRHVRSVDLVGRVGGDEFVVIMPETSLAGAATVAERLRAAVAEGPFLLPGGEGLRITVSIGVAVAGAGQDTAARVFKRADDALYAAKNSGRNRVVSLPHVQRAA